MDTIKSKINKHQKILTQYFRNLSDEYNNSLGSDKDHHSIIDPKTNHFQFVKMGWKKGRFAYAVLIHLNINPKTGNIWIQQNNTEIQLDVELEKIANIPKKHLVLGFRPKYVREHSDYAIA